MSYLPKDEKRKAILEATLELVATVGFAGITARKVAARMGAATGTIHHHFASLDDLKSEVLRYSMAQSMAHNRQFIATLPPYETLLKILLSSNMKNREFENRVWLSAADEMWRNPMLKEAYSEAMLSLVAAVESVISNGVTTGVFTATLSVNQCAWKIVANALTLSSYTYLGQHALSLQSVDEMVIYDIQTTLGYQG